MKLDGVLRQALIRMLPRLQAERVIDVVTGVSIGTTPQSKEQQRAQAKAFAKLRAMTEAPEDVRARRPKTWAEHIERLQGLGFDIVVDGKRPGEASTA